MIQQLPKEQRKTLEMAFFDGLDALRNCRDDGRSVGNRQDEDTQRTVGAEKGLPA